jgi:hypothetical protein
MSGGRARPFLIAEDDHGRMRLSPREVRHNSQGYPWIFPPLVEPSFNTVAAARKCASEHFGARPREFASQ